MKRIISIIVVFCFTFGTIPLLAQQPGAQPDTDVKIIKSESVKPVEIASMFRSIGGSDQELKALDSQLKRQGFSPQVQAMGQGNKPNFWGHKETYRNNQNEEGSVSVHLQNYGKSNSKDSAAICRVVFSVKDRSEVYSCALIAHNGDFQNMEEYKVDNNLSVVKANSWWSCVKNYIRSKCPSSCLSALVTCLPGASTVVGYVACVAVKCGSCALKSISCCSCDCSWWCRWAAGCCDR